MLGDEFIIPPIAVLPGVLDEDTVEWIKRHPSQGFAQAEVGQGPHSRIDTDYRNVERAPIDPFLSPVLVGMLDHFVNVFNASHYCYEVSGINQLELLRYVPGGKYDTHRDTGDQVEYVKRKFSIIVQLSEDKDYEGCELVIPMVDDDVTTPEEKLLRKQKGTVIIFPSYLEHFITPLERGERMSIVAWATGPGVR